MIFGLKGLSEIRENIKKLSSRFFLTFEILATVFVLIWVIYIIHLVNISTEFTAARMEAVEREAINSSRDISTKFHNASNAVKRVASKAINTKKFDKNTLISMIKSEEETVDIGENNLVYIDRARNVYSSEGIVRFDDRRALNEILDDIDDYADYKVIYNSYHFLTNEGSVVCVAPVKKLNFIFGYVACVVKFNSLISDSDLHKEIDYDEIMIGKNGVVYAQVFSEAVQCQNQTSNFFDNIDGKCSTNEYADIITTHEKVKHTGEPGIVSAKVNDQDITFVICPIESTDGVCIIHCITKQSVFALNKDLLVNSVALFIIIVVLMVSASLILVYYINKEHEHLVMLQSTDFLTGCLNKDAFAKKAEVLLKENSKLPYVMICMDIVNISMINDTYGHEKADFLIKALSDSYKLRIKENEAYGRINADVFCLLVVDNGELEKDIDYIEERLNYEASKVYINHLIKTKLGCYVINDIQESVMRQIDKANIARKSPKTRNKFISYYNDELMFEARKEEIIESRMEEALKNGEFKVYLQAKFDMKKQHVSGAEALVRWKTDEGKLIPPGDFIPLFEKNGFVEKIDFYMLEHVCMYIRQMLDEDKTVYPVSVNQSRYLLNDINYVNKVKSILLKYKIPVGLIELELTETVFFHERNRMIEMMNELKDMNINLSIEDFGSGYSSFNLLKDVPFDVLKIDRGFLSNSTESEKSKWILKEIVEMAHGLGMEVICEGVETKEQVDLLLSIGCIYAQGFLYARPIPLEEFIQRYNVKAV